MREIPGGDARMIDSDRPRHPRGQERPEGHPEGVLDFCVDDNRRPRCQREYKWTNHHGGEDGRSRVEVVEHAEGLGVGKIDSNFFARFADRGSTEIRVGQLAPPAGEGDLARPGIAGAHGAMDEQRLNAFVAVVQNHGDGRSDHATLEGDFGRSVVAQLSTCVLEGGYAETSSPPSTLITLPVIQSAPGLDRATIAPPRSAGGVSRWCGFRCVAISTSFSLPGILRNAGVSGTPPRNAFTAIPSGASSGASC